MLKRKLQKELGIEATPPAAASHPGTMQVLAVSATSKEQNVMVKDQAASNMSTSY